jgi:hypothetical protein
MSIQPQGEQLRKAVRWVAEARKDFPEKSLKRILEEAALKFNLTPLDMEYLTRGLQKRDD